MIGDCKILVSSDDPPKVLKSESDEILTECGGFCCELPDAYVCVGATQQQCEEVGWTWVTGHGDDCTGGQTAGFGGCECHCFPCGEFPEYRVQGPTSVDLTWSYTETTECWDPPDTMSGNVTNKPLPRPTGPDDDSCGFTIDGDNYYNTCWFYGSGFPSCSISFGVVPDFPTFDRQVSLQITRYCKDNCGEAPAGWYVAGQIQALHCGTGCDDQFGCGQTCVSLGDLDVFVPGVDVPFTIPLTAGGTLSGVFHTDCDEFSPPP